MGSTTRIEWTDHTFNLWHGCTKVSAGCKNCYASTRDKRHLHARADHWGPGAPRMRMSDKYWKWPFKWQRDALSAGVERRVFCASMADAFDVEGYDDERHRLWSIIEQTPDLNWQLLTKRPENILGMIPSAWRASPPPNVWYGTSVESEDVYSRVEILRQVPASVRFLSVEPLLGPVEGLHLEGIHWVIVGGETGAGARPMHPAWVASIRDQTKVAGAAFFFKQWGNWAPAGPGSARLRSPACCGVPSWMPGVPGVEMVRIAKKAAGRTLDGRTWDEFPK